MKYKQPVSVYSRFKRTKPWTLDNIYKLSWILNKPIQDLIVVENQEETCESHFEPVFFLEHYPICYDKRIEMEKVYQRLSKKFKKKWLKYRPIKYLASKQVLIHTQILQQMILGVDYFL